MAKRIRRCAFIIVVLMLPLAALACGIPTGGQAVENVFEEVVASLEVEVTPAEGGGPATGGGEGGAGPVEWASLDELSSYRMVMQLSNQAPDGSWLPPDRTEMTVVNDPPPYSEHVIMTDAAGTTLTELITIGDTMWSNVNGTWMEFPGGGVTGAAPNAAASLPEGLETDMTLVGTETVNGVNCEHYTVDTTVSLEEVAPGMGDVYVVGDVWIAAEAGIPRIAVRYDMVQTWDAGGDNESLMRMQVELFDINQPLVIEPPVMP